MGIIRHVVVIFLNMFFQDTKKNKNSLTRGSS